MTNKPVRLENKVVAAVVNLRFQNLELGNFPQPEMPHYSADEEVLEEHLAV